MKRKSKPAPKLQQQRFTVGHQTFNLSKYKLRGFTATGKPVEIKPIIKISKNKRFKKITGFKIPRNTREIKIFQGRRIITTSALRRAKKIRIFKAPRLKEIFFATGRARTPKESQDLVSYLETRLGITSLGDIQSGTLPMQRFITQGEFVNDPKLAGQKHLKWRIYIAIEGERYTGSGDGAVSDSSGWHIVQFSQLFNEPVNGTRFRENIQGAVGTFVQDTVDRHNGLLDLGRVQTEWRGGGYQILGVEADS